jgi:GH35 family endo-1,4-beta-xylanase
MKGLSLFLLLLIASVFNLVAQTAWYNSAQTRIDTLRKGDFNITVLDKNGIAIKDSIIIKHKKHEFPWGYAIDLYSSSNSGTTNTGSTSSAISTKYGDENIYKTERWGKYVAYNIPAVQGKTYNITMKFAELYFSTAGSRIFDAYIDGVRVLKDFDKLAYASGKNVAFDTIMTTVATSGTIKLEFLASKDNVSINGLVVAESTGSSTLRINCGGSAMTISGKTYNADASYLNTSSASLISSDEDWSKAVMLKYCNYGVCGNQFKWSGIESNKGALNYAPFENTLSWFNKVGWDMRAHTLLWGGNNNEDYHCVPKWVMDLQSNPKAMYDTCRMRVIREVTRYKGKVKEYDVLNEPIHANYLQKLVGDSLNWNCFKWARQADPNARLFVNDYNIIEWGDQTNTFVEFVKKILKNGAPVDGIGAQCHIGSSVDLINFKSRFDQLAQFGLPIKVTEFDMGAKSLTQQQYAAEMAKMLRLCFSHPAIEGFVFWGLKEPTWVPESIINVVREDKTTRIAADTIYNLIHKTWSTNISSLTNDEGKISFKGYYGDYDVLVKVNGIWEKYNISCKKAEKGKTFTLTAGSGVARSPQLQNVKIVEPNEIHLSFDKAMANPTSVKSSFKIFDSKLNYISSIGLKTDDSTTIIIKTSSIINERDYLPVSYAQSTYKSADGGVLESFGPIINSSNKPTYLSSNTSADGKVVQVAFDVKLYAPSINLNDYMVNVSNVLNPIKAAVLNATKDGLNLTLTNQIKSSTAPITITYKPGSLLRVDSLYVTSIDAKPVTNSVIVPKFVSSTTNSTGAFIYVVFDQIMAEPTIQESNFVLTSSLGRSISVTKAQLYASDKKRISLTLSSAVYKGEVITVKYNPGIVNSSTGLPVAGFTGTVTNVSTTDLTNVIDEAVRLYPSPFKNELIIENTGNYKNVSIFDLSGRKCLYRELNNETSISLNTTLIANGIYIVELANDKEKSTYKVEKK